MMKFGVKQKIILVLVAALTLTAALNAILASSLTNSQNQTAAFTDLDRDLITWDDDLQGLTNQQRDRALAVLGDAAVMQQLAQIVTLKLDIEDPARSRGSDEMARTFGYAKSVSLNQMNLALRTGGFSSIAVYVGGKLSHYVSETDAGMMVPRAGGRLAWLTTSVTGGASLPIQNWPAWNEGAPPPSIAGSSSDAAGPAVSFAFLPQQSAMVEVAIPIEGQIDRVRTEAGDEAPYLRFLSHFAIAGSADNGAAATKLVAVVFRKSIGQADLQNLAKKTGKSPYIFSLDGAPRVVLGGSASIPRSFLQAAPSDGPSQRTVRRTISRGGGSFFADMVRWSYAGKPRFTLVMTSSRVHALKNIHETVFSIAVVSALIAAMSIGFAIYWIGRFVDPIIALTSVVKQIKLKNPSSTDSLGGLAAVDLRPIEIQAPDEMGELAAAFNLLLAELRQSFETLEHRVRTRTGELREQTLYLRTLLDTLPLWVWLKDTQGRYLAVNEACAHAAGLDAPGDMVGKCDAQVWPHEDAEHYRAEDAAVLATRQRRVTERQEQQPDTEDPIWIESFRTPVLDEDGAVLGIVGVARNIGEQKAAEAAREAALAEAVRLVHARSEFMAQMSHELRTPLNAILGYAQTLQHDQHLTARQVRGLGTIRSSGEHLLTLINDILDLARVDAAKLTLEVGEAPLGPLLQAVADMVSVKAEEKGLSFIRELAVDLPPVVRCDGIRLRQVLINLIGNAVKFTDHGTVTLRVRRAPMDQNDSIVTEDGAPSVRLRFEVEDTGIGMSPDQAARIFQPFEQVAEGTRQRQGGAGLGLAISRQLVTLMGGDIRVQSEPGRGSLFWFELNLPLVAKPFAAATPAAPSVIAYEGERMKILVVDDAPHNRLMLIDALAPIGFEVVDALDGEDAVDQALRFEPDLIVMDVMMPVLDGVETTRRIRNLPQLSHTRIIAVTASANSEMEARCRAAGVDAFVGKPVNQVQLLEVIGELLDLKWTYQSGPHEADGAVVPAPAELIVPPSDELSVLYQLAMAGNMRPIRERANYLLELDPRYAAFANRLRSLAEDFQSKAILALVERHLQAVDEGPRAAI